MHATSPSRIVCRRKQSHHAHLPLLPAITTMARAG
jgi:hypothetical protein